MRAFYHAFEHLQSSTDVAFGSRYKDRPKVREAGAKSADPDPYPGGFGLQKVKARDYKPLNELKAAPAR